MYTFLEHMSPLLLLYFGQIDDGDDDNDDDCIDDDNDQVMVVVYRGVGHAISNYYGPGSGRIWLHGLACQGNELSLIHCNHSGWGLSSYHCSHSYDISISCANTTTTTSKKHCTANLQRVFIYLYIYLHCLLFYQIVCILCIFKPLSKVV